MLAALLDLTGLVLHQWLGLAVGLLAVYHLLAHWGWVKAVSQRLLERTSAQAQLYYLVDAGLLTGFSLVVISGLVVSTWLDLSLANYAYWRNLHEIVTLLTLGLIVVKVGVHGRWIVKIGRKVFQSEHQRTASPTVAVRPAPASNSLDRGDFLRLMGIVSAAALLATVSALREEEASIESASASQAEIEEEIPAQVSSRSGASSGSSSSSGCSVRCTRGCSYPGHCRKYVDANNNNRCDLGECM